MRWLLQFRLPQTNDQRRKRANSVALSALCSPAGSYVFASDIAPGRLATAASLSTKTSQTLARLLGANADSSSLSKAAAHRASFDDLDEAPKLSHQPHVHVPPPHSRAPKRQDADETPHLSPLRSTAEDFLLPGTVSVPAHAGAGAHGASSAPALQAADPRFDENRWDNEFLGPLLPLQVTCE